MAKQPIRQREKPTQSVTSTSIENWSGPLPPPAALESFNRIIPGGAERILAMAEKEQGHRVELEKSQLAGAIKEARRG